MRLLNWFARRPLWLRILIKLLLIGLIGMIDHLTGEEIAFSIFYLVPVATTAWIDGKVAGIFMSFVCGGVWLDVDLTAGHEYTQSWIPLWNMSVRIGFFVAVAIILARLKVALDLEEHLARVDGLTGCWNARHFLELVQREIQRCTRSGRPITVVYVDLDNFKQVNDTKGHAQGDALLCAVGGKIRQELRSPDFAGRLGGDEFALVLPEADYDQASVTLRRVKHSLDDMFQMLNSTVSISLGAITFQIPDASANTMLKAADDLMYQIKCAGKNAIRHESAPMTPISAHMPSGVREPSNEPHEPRLTPRAPADTP